MNIFTYGTLMYNDIMKALTGKTFPTIPAAVKGFHRVQLKGKVYPGLVPNETQKVHGILHRDVDRASFEVIDRFEGDLYDRATLEIQAANGEFYRAVVYTTGQSAFPLVTSEAWDPDEFLEKHAEAYKNSCRKFATAISGS